MTKQVFPHRPLSWELSVLARDCLQYKITPQCTSAQLGSKTSSVLCKITFCNLTLRAHSSAATELKSNCKQFCNVGSTPTKVAQQPERGVSCCGALQHEKKTRITPATATGQVLCLTCFWKWVLNPKRQLEECQALHDDWKAEQSTDYTAAQLHSCSAAQLLNCTAAAQSNHSFNTPWILNRVHYAQVHFICSLYICTLCLLQSLTDHCCSMPHQLINTCCGFNILSSQSHVEDSHLFTQLQLLQAFRYTSSYTAAKPCSCRMSFTAAAAAH